jgi:hypothetical protein
MKDFITSNVTNKKYIPSEIVRIINISQVIGYLNHGAELLDVYPSYDYKSDKQILVFIFNRKDTTQLYDLWCKHELN